MISRMLFTLIGGISLMAADSAPAPAPARVFIYQADRGIRANPVFCDGIEVASLRHRWSYFVLQLPAGEHSFNGRHRSGGVVLQLLPGQTSYLRLMDAGLGEKLVVQSAEEGRSIVESGKLHRVDPDDVRDHARVLP